MRASEETMQWLAAYYEAMDNLRFDEVAAFVHPDCVNTYPTGNVIESRDTILARGAERLGQLERIRHRVVNAWEEGDELIFEVAVTHWRRDGEVVERPGVGIFTRRDGQITQARLFVDSRDVWE